jgi:hypothetical protein
MWSTCVGDESLKPLGDLSTEAAVWDWPVSTDRVDVRWSGYLFGRGRDGGFVLCGAEVAEGGVASAGVVPALDVVEELLVAVLRVGQARRWMSSVFMVAKNDSATALSQHWPLRPTDKVTPRSLARLAYWADV